MLLFVPIMKKFEAMMFHMLPYILRDQTLTLQ